MINTDDEAESTQPCLRVVLDDKGCDFVNALNFSSYFNSSSSNDTSSSFHASFSLGDLSKNNNGQCWLYIDAIYEYTKEQVYQTLSTDIIKRWKLS